MEASQELALFRNIDLDVAPSPANEETESIRLRIAQSESTKMQKKRKIKSKVRNRFSGIEYSSKFHMRFFLQNRAAATHKHPQLDPSELLFFSKNLDVLARDGTPPTDKEKSRMKLYKTQIGKMSADERRRFRAKRDIRYLHKLNNVPTVAELPTKDLPCLHHVAGKCEHKVCIYNHQMRLPRQFGVCRFYLKNACTKGVACMHMHSEFPCKYYYLGMPHPKNVDVNNCRFTHGDVLNENTKRFFLNQIEFWVKEKTGDNADDFEQQMSEMVARFDEQERKLEIERQRQQEIAPEMQTSSVEETSTFRKLLNETQFRQLAADKITSFERLQRMSIAELEHYRLTMDQIYEIKMHVLKPNQLQTDQSNQCAEESSLHTLFLADADRESRHLEVEEAKIQQSVENSNQNETKPNIQLADDEQQISGNQSEYNSDGDHSDEENRLTIIIDDLRFFPE